jgi:hypothetical protein
MRRRVTLLAIAAIATLLTSAAVALAVTTEVGNLKVSATAEFMPRGFPEHGTLPTTFSTSVHIRARNNEQPPALKTLIFEFDKHGRLNTKGVPTCTAAKLEGKKPAQAKAACAGALVGEGKGKARVESDGKPPSTISSPIYIFNAAPEGGRPAMIAYAWETVPSPQALLVPFSVEKVSNGRYGYRTEIELPQIAGGDGAALLAEVDFGRTYSRHGKKVGYVEAECSGGRLQVYGKLLFADGSMLQSLLSSPCHNE